MLFIGVQNWFLWAPLFLLNTLLLQSWGFYDVVIADVIDEDIVVHERKESMSTSVHGVQALFVKPAQSVAPILGVYFLTEYAINHSTAELADENMLSTVQHHAFVLWAWVNLGTAILQLGIWRHFTLHGSYLKSIKEKLSAMDNTYEPVPLA